MLWDVKHAYLIANGSGIFHPNLKNLRVDSRPIGFWSLRQWRTEPGAERVRNGESIQLRMAKALES